MDLTGVVGVVVGAVVAILPNWISTRGSRRLKAAELQEQTIKDLQDVLADLRPPKPFERGNRSAPAAAPKSGEPESKEGVVLKERQKVVKEVGADLDRLSRRIDLMVAFNKARRRAEILNSRVQDAKSRQLVTEMLTLAEEQTHEKDRSKYFENLRLLDAKFSVANDRLGEVLRGLH